MAPNNAPKLLQELLTSIGGKHLAKLTGDMRETFMQDNASKFCSACQTLQDLVLQDHEQDRKWLWQCEPANTFDGEWVASFSVVKVDHVKAMAGESMKVHMAVAMNPGMKFTVDLFADSHLAEEGLTQSKPTMKISVAVSGDPELVIAESYLAAVKDDFPMGMNGVLLQVVSGDESTDEILDPSDIHEAFLQAAESARLAGDETTNDSSITDTVYVELVVDQGASVTDLTRALVAMGNFFTSASNALQYV